MAYLGGLFSDDAKLDSEISRRIGAGSGVFRALQSVWSHAGLSILKKKELFQSLVVSRLFYGLSSAWLVKSQLRRIEGFYARCLRRLLRIPAAYISRVSNATVYQKAGVEPLGTQLLKMQMAVLGKTAQTQVGHPMRHNVFVGDSLRPLVGYYIRRPGRPRQDCTNSLLEKGAELRRSRASFERELLCRPPQTWKAYV